MFESDSTHILGLVFFFILFIVRHYKEGLPIINRQLVTVRCTCIASVIKRITPSSSDGVPLDLQMGPMNAFSELFEELW